MKTGMNKMIKYNSSIGYTLLCLFIVLQIIACGKMDANYADFIKDGEIVYTGRAEALTSYPGKNRVKLSWLLVSDPKVKLCKVFWNNKTDSLAIPVQKTGKTDTIQTIISNLNEGLYAFQVYTYDDEGHTSVKSEVPGVSYGASYAGSIFNRSLKSVKKAPNGKDIWLEWFGAAQQTAAVQVNYINTDGQPASVVYTERFDNLGRSRGFSNTDTIYNYKNGTSFNYRTGFLPGNGAIDTFYTAFKNVTP
jgi:hypothetical protein